MAAATRDLGRHPLVRAVAKALRQRCGVPVGRPRKYPRQYPMHVSATSPPGAGGEEFTTENTVFDPALDPEGSDRREAQTRRENTEQNSEGRHAGLRALQGAGALPGAGLPGVPGAGVIVAVSGGPDSVALLRAMVVLAGRREWRMRLAVGHVQHHLRAEAEGDAEFVAELARKLELPFLRADIEPAKAGGNLEGQARRMRYAALAEMAASFSAEYVATAHHADDQLETVLMRLMRGASAAGLAGMAWRRRLAADRAVTLIRPMLGVEHAGAMAFLESIQQPWRTDHTNEGGQQLRAALRGRVVPGLKELRRDVAGQAVLVGEHLRQVGRLLEEAVARAADHVVVEGGTARLDRNDARALPGVVLAGLLRRLLLEAGAKADGLGRRKLAAVARAVADRRGGERRFEMGGKVRVVVTREAVEVEGRVSGLG